jgi:hypothetical protein
VVAFPKDADDIKALVTLAKKLNPSNINDYEKILSAK